MAENQVNDTVEPQTDDVSQDTVEPKMFTQEEVNAMISERVKREQSKTQKAIDEALNNFKKEQEEEKQFSKMSENERLQKQLEKLQKDNADLLAKQKRSEMMTEVRQELAKDGYNITDGVLNLLVTDDVEITSNNTKAIKEYTDGLKEQWETERSKGVTPKTSTEPSKPASAFDKKLQDIMKGKI